MDWFGINPHDGSNEGGPTRWELACPIEGCQLTIKVSPYDWTYYWEIARNFLVRFNDHLRQASSCHMQGTHPAKGTIANAHEEFSRMLPLAIFDNKRLATHFKLLSKQRYTEPTCGYESGCEIQDESAEKSGGARGRRGQSE